MPVTPLIIIVGIEDDNLTRAVDQIHQAGDYDVQVNVALSSADLVLFADFLYDVKVKQVGALNEDPQAWRGVTWGLVESFKVWQLQQGYAIGSINGRLSTVRTFARLAA